MLIADWLRRLADFLDPLYARPVPYRRESPFERDEKARSERSEAGLALMDPEVHGYLLLMLRVGDEGGEIEIAGLVHEVQWPAFIETMSRISTMAAEDVVGR